MHWLSGRRLMAVDDETVDDGRVDDKRADGERADGEGRVEEREDIRGPLHVPQLEWGPYLRPDIRDIPPQPSFPTLCAPSFAVQWCNARDLPLVAILPEAQTSNSTFSFPPPCLPSISSSRRAWRKAQPRPRATVISITRTTTTRAELKMAPCPARGSAAQCPSRKSSISPSMSPSPAPSQDDEGDAGNGPYHRIWLTLRLRCELCKQRKVCALIACP